MKRLQGFTLVEVVIVVAVMGILAGIVTVSYNQVQKGARDDKRNTTAAIIADALEKYYQQNGEYPSVRSLVNSYSSNTAEAVSTKLDIPQDSLRFPNTPSSARTALSTSYGLSNDYIRYSASRPSNDTSCQSNISGGCDTFTLTYRLESGSTETINSRYGN